MLPVVAALSRQLVPKALSEGGEQLRSLGAGPFAERTACCCCDERFGVLTVLLAAFGRAVSEVGAVMIVGGNIDGFTRVMTTAIALETSKGDLPLALALGLVLLGVVLRDQSGDQRDAAPRVARARSVCRGARSLARTRADAMGRSKPADPLVLLEHAGVRFGDVRALRDVEPDLAPRRARGAGRRQRQRQDHAAAPAARVGAARGRRASTAITAACRRARCCSSGRSCCAVGALATCCWRLWLRGVPRAQRDAALPPRRCGASGSSAGAALGAHAVGRPAAAPGAGAGLGAASPTCCCSTSRPPASTRRAKREVEALIAALADDGVTLVISTHNLGQAKRLATRVVYLEAGRVGGRPAGGSISSTDALPAEAALFRQRRIAVDLKIIRRSRPCCCGAAAGRCPAWAQDKSIVMASTTSTEQSGLFGHLLPAVQAGHAASTCKVVAVGTGQAHRHGRRGDADVLFVHDTAAEEKFVAEGFAAKRLPVMYNDFVLVGPKSDPAASQGQATSPRRSRRSRPAKRRSSRAATRAARTPPSCACGRPARHRRRRRQAGAATRNAAAAWARH